MPVGGSRARVPTTQACAVDTLNPGPPTGPARCCSFLSEVGGRPQTLPLWQGSPVTRLGTVPYPARYNPSGQRYETPGDQCLAVSAPATQLPAAVQGTQPNKNATFGTGFGGVTRRGARTRGGSDIPSRDPPRRAPQVGGLRMEVLIDGPSSAHRLFRAFFSRGWMRLWAALLLWTRSGGSLTTSLLPSTLCTTPSTLWSVPHHMLTPQYPVYYP